MRQSLKILLLLLIISGSLSAQIFTDSNLPIVIINIDGCVEVSYGVLLGSMKIIYRGEGQRTFVTDQNNNAYINYDGRIDIKIRGNSTILDAKSQYKITTRKADDVTNNNVSLLGMPPENDWILNGMSCDQSFMHDYLAYSLSRQIGEYASRAVYCELIINGEYQGLYLLTEKIKADDNRVNITKIGLNDIYLPELSGGYITVAEESGPRPFWTMKSWDGQNVNYFHEFPKPDEIKPSQHNYIFNQFLDLENTAMVGNASPSNGFPSIIDIPSFINYIIINELASNPDVYWGSTYFHKDRNGKLRAGPVWDFDIAFGNDRSKIDRWQFGGSDSITGSDNGGSRFWIDLFTNDQFRCYLSKRWNELIQPGQPLNLTSLETFIDKTVATISEAVGRDYALWGYTDAHQQHISHLKEFLAARVYWITNSLDSYSSCVDVPVPPLSITKIMYHPEASTYSPDNDNFEFIEITNNSDKIVDLSGVYFGGTGFVYQFPINSTLGPYDSVYLASDSIYFNIAYGFKPYGQFTRHLSNKSENLVLLDAFGNVIDNVYYSDGNPWPDADGNGYYLELSDIDLDNGLASSWEASKVMFTQEAYLNISIEAMSLDCQEGSSGILDITSNTYWTISSSEAWLTLSKASGSEDAAITITAQKNPTINTRGAAVTIKATGLPDRTVIITQVGSKAYLNVSTETMSLGCQEGSFGILNINSSTFWTISSSETWLTLSKASGSGDAAIIITAQKNPTINTRGAAVIVKATGLPDTIVIITQAGSEAYLNVSIEMMSLDCQEGSSGILNINSNTYWTISSSETWLTLSKTSGSGNETITVIAQNNPTVNTRNATVTVKATELPDRTVIITQAGSMTDINDTENNHVKIYPNPARTVLFIEGLSEDTQVSIYDFRGNLILKKQLFEGDLDISTLASGVYTIKLENIAESITRRFVKN